MRRDPFFHGVCCAILLAGPSAFSAFGQEKQQIVTTPDVPAATAITVGDLNGDGRADLALVEAPPQKPLASPSEFRLHLLFQKDGKFAMPADKTLVLGAAAPSGLIIRDFDKDGRNDLAVGLRLERSLSLFLGSERFEKEHRSRYANDSGAGGLSVGRVNKSGLADFLTGAAWRQWQGAERFGEAYFAGPERNDNWRSTLADLDRDGSDDVIFTTYASGNPVKSANNRIRIFYGPFLKMMILQPADAALVATLNSPFTESDKPLLGQVLVGDLNDDDQPDLVVPAPEQTLVYLQDSPTGFSDNAAPSLLLRNVTPLLVADLDGDELCDMAFLPTQEAGLALWHQKKNRPLTADGVAKCRRVAIPRMTAVVASGDVDGDGRQEIVASLSGGGLAVVTLPHP